MASVDVGIGHDDDLVVAEFLQVERLAVLLGADRHAQRREHVLDLLVLPHAVLLRLLDVQDLTAQRHDGLEIAVAARFGRAACRVTLDEEDFGDRTVAARTVGQLAGESRPRKHGLALHHFAGVACRVARRGGQDDLLHDGLGILGVLLQIVAQRRGHRLIDGGRNLVVAQLGLGLALELRLLHLHRNHGREPLAEVVAVDVELQLGEHARILGVFLERTRERPAEAGQVRTALDRVDVVHIRVHVLREGVVVLHGHLDRDAVLFGVEVDDLLDDRRAARGVEVLDELLEALLRVEVVLVRLAFLVRTLVVEIQADALVQERELARRRLARSRTCRRSYG